MNQKETKSTFAIISIITIFLIAVSFTYQIGYNQGDANATGAYREEFLISTNGWCPSMEGFRLYLNGDCIFVPPNL